MRNSIKVLYVGVLIALSLQACTALSQQEGMKDKMEMKMPEGRVMGMSKYDYNETVSRIKQAIEGQNMMVVFTADHQMMLKMAGMETKGMLGIEFFHPRYGKRIFQNDHTAGVEVPLRIVVMEGDMGTMFSYWKPSHTFAKYPKLKGLGNELDGVLETITGSVTR